MMNFKDKLAKYAEIIVNQGVALEVGEPVVIRGFIDAIELCRLIAKEAYKAGASNVMYVWQDDVLDREFAMNASEDERNTYPRWQKEIFDDILDKGGVSISVRAPNPKMYEGVPKDHLIELNKTIRKGFYPFSKAILSSSIKWVVVNAVSKQWANTVYPDLQEDLACEKLWDDIFYCCKLNEDHPTEAIINHSKSLMEKAKSLESKKYKKLLYKGPGTDLEVILPENHRWVGGGGILPNGKIQMSNIPTYEVATLPHKYGVNGRVKATLPLVYNGTLIEEFWFTFKDGKVVDFGAEQGVEALESILETDEGAKYLGEVAIVSQDSEIAMLNQLFYSTLFDENASCHFALGAAYPTCLHGTKGLDKEGLEKLGVNTSMTHVDFMVGARDVNIIGVNQDETEEYILKNGVFPEEGK